MNAAARKIQTIYLSLLLGNTLAASLIWGINTLFLLDAGLSNLEAFAANAFFTAGMVLFEVPTGVVADLKGRRTSFLLGVLTLSISTILYYLMWQIAAPFWAWAGASVLLGLGFTFFSGAVEAWLVDALRAKGYQGRMEDVFAKGQVVSGIAMLTGALGGGFIAQVSNLGVPYIVRSAILILTFIAAFMLMRDIGFKPAEGKRPLKEIKHILHNSLQHGLRNPPVRWVMLTAPFILGAAVYGFYALQPYLLELYGDPKAYGIAGLAAAIIAGAQIAGGLVVPHLGKLFGRRTTILLAGAFISTVALLCMGLFANFWIVICLVVIWGLVYAATTPVRQAYINNLIPSEQRATVLSFASLLGSSGGVASQPLLGRAADVWSYPTSYLLTSAFHALAIPFAWFGRHACTKGKARIADELSPTENPAKTGD